uniref:Uncharacterized protein n=1 Tax=Eutreptiella gymnastica TaxID=73025 RepID=A0A7S4FR06_9EUGL
MSSSVLAGAMIACTSTRRCTSIGPGTCNSTSNSASTCGWGRWIVDETVQAVWLRPRPQLGRCGCVDERSSPPSPGTVTRSTSLLLHLRPLDLLLLANRN